jgi:predicted nucleic acid-binding protein
VGVLAANTASKDHAFWPDELPLVEAVAFAGSKLLGHQQVTDAYLLGLVLRRGGKLATLDERITALAEPDSVQRRAVEAIA